MNHKSIGVERFRILGGGGGQGLDIGWGVQGGGQISSRHMTSMRRNDVASTSFRLHVPTRFLINQCQIITFLILKSDIIENSRKELRGIVLTVPSNQIKVTFIIILPSTWYICNFCLFQIEIEGKCGWIIGGPKGMLAPTLKLLGEGGAGPLPPPPPPLFLRL